MSTDDAQISPPMPPERLSLGGWLWQGLRAALLQKPEIGHSAPTPFQLLLLFALSSLLQTGLARLEVAGTAEFSPAGWLLEWSVLAFVVFLVWAWLGRGASAHPQPVAAWLALSAAALLPSTLLLVGVGVLAGQGLLPAWWRDGLWMQWGLYLLDLLWLLAVLLRLTWQFTTSRLRGLALVVAVLLVQGMGAWQMGVLRPWLAPAETQEADAPPAPGMELTQELFEEQRLLLSSSLASLQAGRRDRVNLYALVYAPFAQDVFLRESGMVTGVLQQRFDARGRVLQLVNHPNTAHTIPWATKQNLQQAILRVAGVMDRQRDVLLVYMTSHGGSDFQLASQHGPLSVEALTPQQLRQMLDQAGIRNRVLVVSACYAGGWVEPLSSDTSLVMTAADATHTSYGCGSLSEFTFFGRAVFDEQLRNTHSFEQAFQDAVPVIARREIEGQKGDGFSNPQIAVGAGIRPVLVQLEKQLDTHPAKPD